MVLKSLLLNMSEEMTDLLGAFFRWWSLPFVLTTVVTLGSAAGALEERAGTAADVALFALVCAAWWTPTRWRMLSAHLLSCAIKLSDMPCVWDGTWWFILLSDSCLPLVGFSALAERLRLEYQMSSCDLHTPKAHV